MLEAGDWRDSARHTRSGVTTGWAGDVTASEEDDEQATVVCVAL